MRQLPTISFEHDGQVYNLSPNDFTAEDELAIYRACGATLVAIFNGQATTLFSIAALLWRHRVTNGEPDLSYTDVARTFRYSDLETLSDVPKEGGSPEA